MLKRYPIAALACLWALLVLAACDNTLETGYVPRALNSSDNDRRAFYAPAFSQPPQADKGGTGFGFQP